MSEIYSKMRVLVVDDVAMMRLTIRNFLNGFGCTDILEACNGELAWQQLTTAAPPINFVLADVRMPESDGISFLKRMRADERYMSLPVIMVTAEGETNSIIEALDAGASMYLIKPVQAEVLNDAIRTVLARNA